MTGTYSPLSPDQMEHLAFCDVRNPTSHYRRLFSYAAVVLPTACVDRHPARRRLRRSSLTSKIIFTAIRRFLWAMLFNYVALPRRHFASTRPHVSVRDDADHISQIRDQIVRSTISCGAVSCQLPAAASMLPPHGSVAIVLPALHANMPVPVKAAVHHHTKAIYRLTALYGLDLRCIRPTMIPTRSILSNQESVRIPPYRLRSDSDQLSTCHDVLEPWRA